MDKDILLSQIRTSLSITYDVRTLVEQFIEYGYRVSEHSKWTMRTRATHLRQFAVFCEYIEVADIRNVNIVITDAYFKYYSESHSKSTTNTSKRILKVFVTWLSDYKEVKLCLKSESIQSVRIKDTTPKALDTAIISKVIRASTEQDALLIAVTYEAGLRISEVVGIQVKDISGTDITVTGKGSIERVTHITYQLADELQDFIQRQDRATDDNFFQKDRRWGGGSMSVGTARIRIQSSFWRHGRVKMYPHQLRHTFAINLLQAGCDIVTIQHLLGHQDITTTMTYLRVADTHIKKEYHEYMGESFITHKPIDISPSFC